MTFFAVKWGHDLENRAAHPHQEFLGATPGYQLLRTLNMLKFFIIIDDSLSRLAFLRYSITVFS